MSLGNFFKPAGGKRLNPFNFKQGQWAINDVPVLASAEDLNNIAGSGEYGDVKITTTTTLPNPCPQVIYVEFTTPGQQIILPSAVGTGLQEKGKIIYFKVSPLNTEDFDIVLADGLTVFLTTIGPNYSDFFLSYSQNLSANGTPIRLWTLDNVGVLGTAAYENIGFFLQSAGGTLTGDLYINGGTSGIFNGLQITKNADASVQLNVKNLSNTSNASVLNFLSVAGASSGNPVYGSYRESDGAGFFWGFRNSDSNFVVAPNFNLTGGMLEASSTGAITFPLTPAASAYINATQNNVTGDGTYVDITGSFFTKLRDNGNDFINGTMGARKTGMYKATAQFILSGLAADHTFGDLNIVTSLGTFTVFQINPAAIRTIPGIVNTACFFGNATFPMIAGDTAKWQFSVSGTNKTVDIVGGAYSLFSFELIA